MTNVEATTTSDMDKPPVYEDADGNIIYRASALGMCSKALIAIRQGADRMPPPDWMLERFQQGNEYEEHYYRKLDVAIGRNEWKSQIKVKLQVADNVYIVGHADLLLFANDVTKVRDIKALSPSMAAAMQYNLLPIYAWQLSVYHVAVKKVYPYVDSGFIIIPKPEQRDLANIDPQKIISAAYESHVSSSPIYSYDDIRQRVEYIESQAEIGIPPDDCEYKFFPCPVYYLHPEDERDIGTTPELDELITEWYALKEQEDETIAARKEIGDRVKQLMQEAGYDDATSSVGNVKIVRKSSKRRNWRQMEKDGIDLSPYTSETFYSYIQRS